jgi:hypothetical protein
MAEQEPEVVDWFWVDKKDGRHILVVGKPDLPINDVILECGNISSEHQDRIVDCVNACRGLTEDQVDAIQALVAQFTKPGHTNGDEKKYCALRDLFPYRRAGG